jgi:hypothetical protein
MFAEARVQQLPLLKILPPFHSKYSDDNVQSPRSISKKTEQNGTSLKFTINYKSAAYNKSTAVVCGYSATQKGRFKVEKKRKKSF